MFILVGNSIIHLVQRCETLNDAPDDVHLPRILTIRPQDDRPLLKLIKPDVFAKPDALTANSWANQITAQADIDFDPANAYLIAAV